MLIPFQLCRAFSTHVNLYLSIRGVALAITFHAFSVKTMRLCRRTSRKAYGFPSPSQKEIAGDRVSSEKEKVVFGVR